jgi:hypothetical protein
VDFDHHVKNFDDFFMRILRILMRILTISFSNFDGFNEDFDENYDDLMISFSNCDDFFMRILRILMRILTISFSNFDGFLMRILMRIMMI